MKNRILFLVTVLFIGSMTFSASAQVSPFSAKVKSLPSVGFSPQKIQPVPGLTGVSSSRLQQAAAFHPVSHPFPSSGLSKSTFGEKHYGQNGQMIFLSGILPGQPNRDFTSPGNLEDACFEYLDAIKSDLKIKDPRSEFQVLDQRTDELGMTHVKMQQVCSGIPLYGGEIYLHASNGQVSVFNGNPYPTSAISDLQPSVAKAQAQMKAITDVSTHTVFNELDANQKSLLNYQEPVTELVIYNKNRGLGKDLLTWHVTVRPNFLERWEYFVDAKTGTIIHFYNNTQTDGDVTASGADLNGVTRSIHAYLQGGSYLMVDVSKPMYNPQNQEGTMRTYDANYTSPSSQGFNPGIASSANNSWGPKVISSQYNAGITYEYFRTTHNKNSWNDKGGSILSVINATETNGAGLDNAYWNGVCIVYGNGDTQFKPLAGALDVSAHELGHAFDEASANLEYQNQSGAMNEAFSDIAGAVVERLNWKIGEDIVKPGMFPTGCLRDMSNPHNGGNTLGDPGYQPATVSEMYNGTQDNGGVHINSGIINNAFYKYSTAVGIAKGEKTFFRALFQYLTRSSQFIDCRLAVVQSAKDLYGDGSAEVNAAKTAFDEVGIVDGSGGNYQNQLPVNPGQDYVLAVNTDPADPNSLYISNTGFTSFSPISQTPMISKPSVVDNGSYAVFIGSDKMMHGISLGSPPQETIIENEAVWSNVAISKDGTMIAAVTEFQDSAIYIYSFQKTAWVKAHLYNPTSQQGIVTNNVLYADALEWDYSGEFVMYDAYNQMNSSTSGQNVDYWDISFMHIWDKAASNWSDGEVFKLVSGIPEGISIGNPSLSKNSPNVCAFDYVDGSTNTVTVLASNLESGDFIEVYNNGSTLSYPNYSKMDDQIIFTSTSAGNSLIASIPMSADKIHPASGTATAKISYAKWGVWYAQGNRALGVENIVSADGLKVYPNPTHANVTLSFEKAPKNPVRIDVYDNKGLRVYSSEYPAAASITIDLGGLSAGLYLLKATGQDFSATRKVVIQ